VAIANAYDTLTHGDARQPALSEEEVLVRMHQEADGQFDPDLLAAFFRRLPEIRRIAQTYPDRKRNGARGAGSTSTNGSAAAPGLPVANPVSEIADQLPRV
jgi:HD-GYP domain-containing protein (c-di-GMP phosphodiesterase class II)